MKATRLPIPLPSNLIPSNLIPPLLKLAILVNLSRLTVGLLLHPVFVHLTVLLNLVFVHFTVLLNSVFVHLTVLLNSVFVHLTVILNPVFVHLTVYYYTQSSFQALCFITQLHFCRSFSNDVGFNEWRGARDQVLNAYTIQSVARVPHSSRYTRVRGG